MSIPAYSEKDIESFDNKAMQAWSVPGLGESLIPFITDGQGEVAEFQVRIREDWIDPLKHVFRKLNLRCRDLYN
ncbi:MAG TPA: hypothetical protein VN653_01665 [Anaerolineales bacterium]|nr:hypothetical protein [Anaerolineales bacterium]